MTDFTLRPLTVPERKYTYAQSSQLQGQTGNIGYLRGDFGSSGDQFYTTWFDTRPQWKSDEFKLDLDDVINALRSEEYGLLQSRSQMVRYGRENKESEMQGAYTTEFGFRADTEKYAFVLRCNPTRGDYNFYCLCYVKEWLDKHIEEANRDIRFIDSHYKELFRIPDGERIIVTDRDGKTESYPVFYVMANTGMRVGEITGLRWSDIDLKKGIIRVNHTLVYYNHRDEKGCYFSINTPKTKAGEREIPMTEGVKQAFLMEREFQSQAEISSKSRVDGYDDFIFVNRYGDVQNQGNLNKALRRMMRDCNDEILEKYGADSDPVLLPQFSCHILRHTFATRLCESGANLKFIQSILGHADVSTTMNIYVDVTDALKKKEITAFDDYMTTKLET